jgi:tetratricopeptide (TPR) repeat protein
MTVISRTVFVTVSWVAWAIAAVCPAAYAQTPPSRILVMPFENVKRDGRIVWLGEATAAVLTDDLAALGTNPITRSERLAAFERLQLPAAAALTDATVIRVGQLVGADRVVVGTLQLADDALVVRARSIALDTGRVQADVTDRGALADLYGTLGRVARRIEPSSRGAGEDPERQHPPVAAFENYIKGLLAETPATAINYLNTAIRLHPAFDRARLALWDVYTEQGEHEQALASLKEVNPDSTYARRASFLAGLSQLELDRFDEAFKTFKALADAHTDGAALNNLGIVQLRRGAAAQGGQAAYFFNKAAESDPADSDYIFNLGYAYWMARDTQAAIYWLREAVRRRPTDGVAHYVLGTALASAGSLAESAREKELARRLSSEYAQWDRRPAADPIPKGLERVKNDVELPHGQQIVTKIGSTEQRDQQELTRFYLESGRRLFDRENDREAAAELNRALYLSPYLADAHMLLGRIHLRNGRVREAIDAFKIALWSAETAGAHAALGEAYRQNRDLDAARAEAQRALAMDPTSAEAQALLARLDGR